MTTRDWVAWHDDYDDTDSMLRRRLTVVQRRIREALDAQAPGPVRVLSMCAGQGRDLLGVLADHPRRDDVRARLVELDPRNAELARRSAPPGVEVVTGDASLASAYEGIVPVHIALVCGVFGNIPDQDIKRTIELLPMFCRTGTSVIWTRHREDPDITPTVRSWFAENGFTEIGFDGTDFGVGAHRFDHDPLPYRPETRLFTFW
jgi:hypothetical protein